MVITLIWWHVTCYTSVGGARAERGTVQGHENLPARCAPHLMGRSPRLQWTSTRQSRSPRGSSCWRGPAALHGGSRCSELIRCLRNVTKITWRIPGAARRTIELNCCSLKSEQGFSVNVWNRNAVSTSGGRTASPKVQTVRRRVATSRRR